MEHVLAEWLHNEGYHHESDKRKFKLFTFSKLLSDTPPLVRNGHIAFRGDVSFYLSSVNEKLLSSLATFLLTDRERVRLGPAHLMVKEVAIVAEPEVSSEGITMVKALSPITTYSTYMIKSRKKTYYYAPHERAWGDALIENLKRKARALSWSSDIDKDLEGAWVRAKRVRDSDKSVSSFKGTVIEAWSGTYELKLPEAYFRLAYGAGMGAKNAQGFGMIGVIT